MDVNGINGITTNSDDLRKLLFRDFAISYIDNERVGKNQRMHL